MMRFPLTAPRLRVLLLVVATLTLPATVIRAQTPSTTPRPRIGVALGGGSARGIAHVGVLRWLEEHHIPVDVVSGTSMGGLIGGSYATGMTPDEVEAMLGNIDWNAMFGSSDFQYQNVRRKRDSRAYPSHLEFGLKKGFSSQPSLNSGQQVDLLLEQIAAPYYALGSFNDLPTPFHCVAFDLRTAQRVVLKDGRLGQAMRATMSLPAVFPPVVIGRQILVDGGTVDNVPADVARDMGADKVIAVNVGVLTDNDAISTSLLGLAGATLDSMMRANTLTGMKGADIVINVPLSEYGSLTWRKYRELIAEGYKAAEASKDQLLPLAVDADTWEAWRQARAGKRRTTLPSIAFVDVEGAARTDTEVMQHLLKKHVGHPLDLVALEASITEMGGMGRYETLNWQIVNRDGTDGLRIDAVPKSYAPPFLLLGLTLENTTSDSFRFGLGGRYLGFDALGWSGSELRLDASIGSDPSAGAAIYLPLGRSRLFLEPRGAVRGQTLDIIDDHNIVASYHETVAELTADGGVNLGQLNEVRGGVTWGRLDASVRVGDPGLPSLSGEQSSAHLIYTHDSQDDVAVPSRGAHVVASLTHFITAPVPTTETTRTSDGVTQAVGVGSWLKSLDHNARNRVFVSGGAGTSFGDHPLATEQFALGGPFQMSAFDTGEKRGDNFMQVSAGYLRQTFRLPDFLGGPVLIGGWLEEGSAFDQWNKAQWDTNFSTGLIGDTLIGPVFLGASVALDGSSRFYISIGKVFR